MNNFKCIFSLKSVILSVCLTIGLSCKNEKDTTANTTSGEREDLLVGNSDFEGDTYGDWSTEGTAFGTGPIAVTKLESERAEGKKLASSMASGDEAATGKLMSPEFTIERGYINFLVSGGNWPAQLRIKLMIDGKEKMFDSGNQFEAMLWMSWDVSKWQGKTAKIVIEDADNATINRLDFLKEGKETEVNLPMAHINIDHVVQSDTNRQYQEKFRPQFHFSPAKNWINDPNGLVYSDGVWHLFAQYDPYLIKETGNQSWLHSSSTDLLHWVEDPIVPEPLLNSRETGQAYTGAGIVDHDNLLGLKAGADAPDVLVAYYLRTKKGLYYAYSDDGGTLWKEYPDNPVIAWKNKTGGLNGNRIDAPKPTRLADKTWIAPMFDDREKPVTQSTDAETGTLKTGTGVTFIVSDNLKQWYQKQKKILGFGEAECLEAFEMPVYDTADKNTGKSQWVMNMGHNGYALATLKVGAEAELEKRSYDFTFGERQTTVKGTTYCPMSWYNAPGNRRIQITWANSWGLGGNEGWPAIDYPDMPFKSQMTFPIELKMVDYGVHGKQLTRTPVSEITALYLPNETTELADVTLAPDGENPLSEIKGELFDIEMDIEPLEGTTEFGLRISGAGDEFTVAYDVGSNMVHLKGFDYLNEKNDRLKLNEPNATTPGQPIKLRVLVDRSLVEALVGDGRSYITATMFPKALEKNLSVYSNGGPIKIHRLAVRKLKSIHNKQAL